MSVRTARVLSATSICRWGAGTAVAGVALLALARSIEPEVGPAVESADGDSREVARAVPARPAERYGSSVMVSIDPSATPEVFSISEPPQALGPLLRVAREVARLVPGSIAAESESTWVVEFVPSAPPTGWSGTADAETARRIESRGRMGAANRRARQIARTSAVRALAQVRPAARSTGIADVAGLSSSVAPGAGGAVAAAPRLESASTSPSVGTAKGTTAARSLLFVWDAGVATDSARGAALIGFALEHGFTGLALEATAVGYGDAAATAAFASLVAEAHARGLSAHALIGFPWFTVAPGAGLPGQMTSSDEGLAMIETIVASGVFDGVVEDSHPYGVEYMQNGALQNWLFDEPARASQDLADYLRAAKVLLGEMELIKTVPFWYDSDARLQGLYSVEGELLGSMAAVIAGEIDLALVLAYRDQLDGPNGIVELVAGEVAIGPTVVAVETSDLGSTLDFLTYFEEGHDALANDLLELSERMAQVPGFHGTSVHYYGPLSALSRASERERTFGFVATAGIRTGANTLVDSYDVRMGSYADQLGFDPQLGAMVAGGEAALLSNDSIVLQGNTIVHGDVRAGRVRTDGGVVITGQTTELGEDIVLPPVDVGRVESDVRLWVRRNNGVRLEGDHSLDRVILQGHSVLTVVGPATIEVNWLYLGRNAIIVADVSRGPVEFVVVRSMWLRDRARMTPTDHAPGSLTVRFAGGGLRLGRAAQLTADVLAPRAHIVLDAGAEVFGRTASRGLTLREGARIHLDRALFEAHGIQ